ncbi:toxin [Sediminibacillus sp. JSM 1682029]|uniref:anthrax toxin lethal factor-related metalloendopeptidase n=1 Tax=Sediminibacillus sp. JSM 1682029 TaxID=3229857 RepID=UPI0035242622
MGRINRLTKPALVIFIFLIFPFIDITSPFHGITLNKANGSDYIRMLEKLDNYDLLDEIVVVPESPENPAAVTRMVTRLNHIDRSLLQLMAAQQVKVRLFEGRLTDEPLLYHLKWKQPRGWRQDTTWEEVPGAGGGWLVSAKIGASLPGNGHGAFNLELHETGHTIYRLLGTVPRLAEQMEQNWKEEAAKLFPGDDYFLTYPSEYFSEVFAYYYAGKASKQTVSEKAPKTYRFFTRLKQLDSSSIPPYYFN